MNDLDDIELQFMELNERLRPIATRPVDITDPNWMTLLSQRPHPLDEAGIRSETEALLEVLVIKYRSSGDETRRALRSFFASYKHFAWAATFSAPAPPEDDFRRHLLLFSLCDQGDDSRDALLHLQQLCAKARAAGVATEPILAEVAGLSSDEDKYGMGSTRQFLRRALP